MPEIQTILLVGPPGAGKGLLGPHLAELLKAPHVSSGRVLRASVEQGDPASIAEQVRRGHAVPDRVVAQLMESALGDRFVLDGFPRNTRQAAELDRILAARGQALQLVLELVVPDEVASARLSRRARMESRSDDNPVTVAARLVAYRRDAGPLLAHYAGRVRRVNAAGDVDDVFERAERAIAPIVQGGNPPAGP